MHRHDPVNSTFAAYTSLDVHLVEIMENNNINPRRFDEIVELIMAHEHDAVIDAGATSFLELAHYMITNQIPTLFHELKRTPYSTFPSSAGPHFSHTARISRIGQPVPSPMPHSCQISTQLLKRWLQQPARRQRQRHARKPKLSRFSLVAQETGCTP